MALVMVEYLGVEKLKEIDRIFKRLDSRIDLEVKERLKEIFHRGYRAFKLPK